MDQNGPQWTKMGRSGLNGQNWIEWTKKDRIGQKLTEINRSGPKWIETDING